MFLTLSLITTTLLLLAIATYYLLKRGKSLNSYRRQVFTIASDPALPAPLHPDLPLAVNERLTPEQELNAWHLSNAWLRAGQFDDRPQMIGAVVRTKGSSDSAHRDHARRTLLKSHTTWSKTRRGWEED